MAPGRWGNPPVHIISYCNLITFTDRWGDHIRDYMDRWITSLTCGSPPPCKQALSLDELEPGKLVADKADTATAIKRK